MFILHNFCYTIRQGSTNARERRRQLYKSEWTTAGVVAKGHEGVGRGERSLTTITIGSGTAVSPRPAPEKNLFIGRGTHSSAGEKMNFSAEV